MKAKLCISTVLLLTGSIFTGEAFGQSRNQEFKPALGWILVKSGTIPDIRAAIIGYDGISKEIYPGTFKVELHRQSNGEVAVLFPDGLPAYDLANMTAWLNVPPDQPDVYGAVSWIVSPSSRIKYHLKLEAENTWGDTPVGSSDGGSPIRVYLPETGVSEISKHVSYVTEPVLEVSLSPVKIEITLDTNTGFGNPDFVVNKPLDYDWGL